MFTRFRKKQLLSPGIYRGQQQDDDATQIGRIRLVVLAVAFVFLVITITKQLNIGTNSEEIDSHGAIAKETVIAEIDFESEDVSKTREAGDMAAAKVPDVFVVDDARVRQQTARFDEIASRIQAFRPEVEQALREAAITDAKNAPQEAAKAIKPIADRLSEQDSVLQGLKSDTLSIWLTPNLELPQNGPESAEATTTATGFALAHADELIRIGRSGLEYILSYGVLKPGERGSDFSMDPERHIVITRTNPAAGQYGEDDISLSQALSVESAQAELRSRIAKATQDLPDKGVAPVDRIRLQDAAYEVARLCIADTLQFDGNETNKRRETARRNVEPVKKQIMSQEVIQRKGERWTEQSRMDVETYKRVKALYDQQTSNVTGAIAGHMILVGLILFAFVRALPWLDRNEEHRFQVLCLSLMIVCGIVGIGRTVTYFIDKGFIVPAAAGAILLVILTNARVAGFVSMMTALLLSIQFDYNWQLLVVACSMSFTGVMSIYRVRKRSDMGNASVKATVVGMLLVVAMALAQDSLFADSTLYSLMMIGVNGVFCLGLVPAVLSPLERLFGITTDIQLLEYSDLNNPVLSRLAMEVPATYAHSLMIGQLAEAAADAVGANGLMARVCAYYHDIGKMKRPEYFVENQTGANIHDELSPRLSARAIASHVSEGAEMARELHLPKPIIDGILEHHGTQLISFFYKEACAQSKHGGVLEADFRYPGPRPHRRETAILMICDAVESAVRTLKNPNEERVREMIDRIITSRASDRQFDECNLTLKDLDTIAEVLTKRVASTQHKRIAYPDQKPEPKVSNVIPMSGGQE